MNPPGESEIVTTGLMGLWALLGAIMRSGVDWRDPDTKKFSWPRFLTAGATALVLGQISAALGLYYGWEPYASCSMASILGYLGPAAALALLKQRYGVFNGKPDSKG